MPRRRPARSAANPTRGYAAAAALAYIFWRRRKPPRQIAVLGSTNPGKLDACQRGADAWSPNFRFTFIGVDTDSGVSEQPVGLDETLLGARNRAAGALRAVAGASIGVGLESGVLQVEGALFDVCACAIFDGTYMCVGLSSSWPLPPRRRCPRTPSARAAPRIWTPRAAPFYASSCHGCAPVLGAGSR